MATPAAPLVLELMVRSLDSLSDATAILAACASGEAAPLEVVERCLRLIEALDPRLQAWVEVAPGSARTAAAGTVAGPLAGVPFGVKDIFDVQGFATRLGAPAAFHYTPSADCTAVARLRAAGAIVLGKTHTTEFAYLDPAPTRNPWNPEHTPGGSSSGSAAAVAAGMVPFALGSQTVGSVLRPAAYCGIVGFKPSYGRISTAGVFPLAPSFDHAGVLCRSVRDAALVYDVLAGPDPADPRSLPLPPESCVAALASPPRPPRLALAQSFYAGIAEPAIESHLREIATGLAVAGASVGEVELPLSLAEVRELGQPVMRAEAAAVHARRFAEHPGDFRESIRGLIEAGLATTAPDYLLALEDVRRLRETFQARLEGWDALLIPAAPATAPRGLASTGNGIFCAPASFMGLPAIALPSGLDGSGLPFSVQLVGRHLDETGLLRTAAWVEGVLHFNERPPLARE